MVRSRQNTRNFIKSSGLYRVSDVLCTQTSEQFPDSGPDLNGACGPKAQGFRPDRRHGPAGTRDVPGDFPRICHIFWRDGQDQLESPPMRMYALPDVNAEPCSSEDSFESDLWMTVIAGRKAFAGAL